MEIVIQVFLIFLGIYAGIGLLFGIYFFVKGASQLDPLIKDSKWTVRLLLFPGAVGLWPIVLLKIINLQKIQP